MQGEGMHCSKALALGLGMMGGESQSVRTDDAPAIVKTEEQATEQKISIVTHSIEHTKKASTWKISYCLRNDSTETMRVTLDKIEATLKGVVSNSRVPGHELPRDFLIEAETDAGRITGSTLIPLSKKDAGQRCAAHANVRVWNDSVELPRPAGATPKQSVDIPPGGEVNAEITLEHDHKLYGNYNTLLGILDLHLKLGRAHIRDTLALTPEKLKVPPEKPWPPAPPADHRDTMKYYSAPDSLHLTAHLAGLQSYRFPPQKVRYKAPYRLSYRYFIAPQGEGTYIEQTTQFDSSFNCLAGSEKEMELCKVGSWVNVSRIFQTAPTAEDLVLEFRIRGADIGELWIDDVKLECLYPKPPEDVQP